MRLIALGVLLVTATSAVLAQDRRDSQAVVPTIYITRMNEALAAYTAGDDDAVTEWLKTREGQTGLSFLERVFGPPATWSRAKAAFLMEVAVATPGMSPRRVTALELGCRLFLSRPDALGVNAEDDRFEILWHQAALGLLEDQPDRPVPLASYLDAIAMRLDDAARRHVAIDSRIPLAKAIAESSLCCRQGGPRLDEGRPGGAATFEGAIGAFTRAAADPALHDEALIRGAALQFQTEHPAAALEWLDRVTTPQDDDHLLHYAQSFIRARALDQLNRAPEAVTSYQAARVDAPSAQTPAIGLAAALLRAGRADEAVRVAAQARMMPGDAPDLWLNFRRADVRFVPGWLEEIRRMRK